MRTTILRKLRGAALAATTLAITAAPAGAATTQEIGESVALGAQWSIGQQNHTTGMVGSDFTWSAVAASGYHLADIRDGKYPLTASPGSTNPTAQDYVQSFYTGPGWDIPFGQSGAKTINDFAKATLFAYAAGIDPRRLTANINAPAQLAAMYNPATGAFGNGAPNVHGFALMALQQVGVPQSALRKAVHHLARQQHADGGFTFGPVTSEASYNARSDLDMTGVSLVGLCQGGLTLSNQVVWRAVQFLRSNLQTNGSFYHMYGSNANSNGWAISGLNACNMPPQTSYWTSNGGNTPVDFLLSLQFNDPSNPATYGSYRYLPGQTGVNAMAHQDALRALAGGTMSAEPPLRAVVSQPRWRTAPAVAAGDETPHVFTVDDGYGNVRICRVVAPAGATLDAFLQAARNTGAPAGCVTDYAFEGGQLVELNGARTDIAEGGWRVQRDSRAPVAASQATTIAFGDNVSLSLASSGRGPKGESGADGQNGTDGAKGDTGAQGPKGDTGDTGAQGPVGPIGPVGPVGPKGETGPAGSGVLSGGNTRSDELRMTCKKRPGNRVRCTVVVPAGTTSLRVRVGKKKVKTLRTVRVRQSTRARKVGITLPRGRTLTFDARRGRATLAVAAKRV